MYNKITDTDFVSFFIVDCFKLGLHLLEKTVAVRLVVFVYVVEFNSGYKLLLLEEHWCLNQCFSVCFKFF